MFKISFMLPALLVLFAGTSALAQTNVIYFGGGGDGDLPTTIFDSSIPVLGKKATELGFNMRSCFDGGHSTTEALLKANIAPTNQDFTVKNYRAIIDEYLAKITSGKIKRGEKLMVVMDTHGGKNDGESATHPIAMTGGAFQDASDLRGSTLGTMDDLKKLATLAESKGIKLAIVDLSCHSGNSIQLANSTTCVISASGPNHFGYASFADAFYSQMKPGLSLEDVFLQTREKQKDPSFPMISTQAGEAVQKEEYDLFSPYLNTMSSDGKADKIMPYLKATANQKFCSRDANFDKLIEQVTTMQQILGEQTNPYTHLPLVDSLKKYKALQDQYLAELRGLNYGLYDQNKEKIYYPDPLNPSKTKIEDMSWRDIVLHYPQDTLSYFQDQLRHASSAAQRKELTSLIGKFSAIDVKRKQILVEHPELKDAETKSREIYKSIKSKVNEIDAVTRDIADLSNRMYKKHYEDLKNAEPAHAEPCRDFVL